MENGPPNLGLEEGTIDVECMLVEPQEEHLSMDSVMSFRKKIPENAVDLEDVSRSSGGSDTGIAQEGKDILNGEVLNVMPNEVEVGYFRLDNDFSSMGEEYLLGVEFAESITNLDYGSSEGLQASVSDGQIQVSTTGSDTTCKSDVYRSVDVLDCQNDQFNVGSSDSSDIRSSRACEILVDNKSSFPPGSCSLQNIGKFHNSSCSSFQDVFLDENDGRFSPAGEMFCSPKSEKDNLFEVTGQDGATKISQRQEISATISVQASCTNVLPTQKRSRKPTLRYIDELVDLIPTYSKKRREVSSSTHKNKNKSLGVKDHKKCDISPKAIKQPPEESSVIAIQVPFASLGNNECPDGHAFEMVEHPDSRNLMTKSKGKCVSPKNQNKADKCGTLVNLSKRDDYATSQKKMDSSVTAAQLKKRGRHRRAASQNKRNDSTVALIRKKRNDCFTIMSQYKEDNCRTAVHQKKSDDFCLTAESSEDVSVRRKHHRLWTITEVKKLIDGVSQYGVGRWSRIKKLFFSASVHRTSVDLKDKWRNLLKASGMHDQGDQQGEKKRNMAWRPLPKSILRRVCELAIMYPYPKGQRSKIARIGRDSPDRSTDITLSDYRKILRSISAN